MNKTTDQLVDLVLGAAHERLQARCDRDKIIKLLEDVHTTLRLCTSSSVVSRTTRTLGVGSRSAARVRRSTGEG